MKRRSLSSKRQEIPNLYGEIRLTAELSTETWPARKGCQDIFKVLNEKNLQPRILYPARLSFRKKER